MSWIDDLPSLTGHRALDVATGQGRLAELLVGRYQEVIGIDLPTVLASAPTVEGVRFQGMDATHLDFPDNHFDLVAMSWSVHHLQEPQQVLKEMSRVLKPGGHFLLMEPILQWGIEAQDMHLAAHLLASEVDRHLGRFHAPMYPEQGLMALIAPLELQHLQLRIQPEAEEVVKIPRTELLENAVPWISRLKTHASDPTLPEALRGNCAALIEKLQQVGLSTSPALRVLGQKSV